MKTGLLSVMALCLFSWATAQHANRQSLDSSFKNYFQALEQKDAAKIISYLPHQLFAVADRSELESVVAATLNHDDFSVDFSNLKIIKLAEILKEKGIAYSIVNYEFQLVMKEKNSGAAAVGLSELYESYKSVLDEEHLQFDEKNKTLSIKQAARVYAVNDPAFKGWKFIDNQMYLTYSDEEIIPDSILKKLMQSALN